MAMSGLDELPVALEIDKEILAASIEAKVSELEPAETNLWLLDPSNPIPRMDIAAAKILATLNNNKLTVSNVLASLMFLLNSFVCLLTKPDCFVFTNFYPPSWNFASPCWL